MPRPGSTQKVLSRRSSRRSARMPPRKQCGSPRLYSFLFRRGTFFPFARASDRPIAIACFRLLTFLPLRPLLSVPFLRFFIARLTSLEALLEYLRAILNLLAVNTCGRGNARRLKLLTAVDKPWFLTRVPAASKETRCEHAAPAR